jgi:hypothetical protein
MERPLIPTVWPVNYSPSRLPEVVRQIDEASRLLTLELRAADRRSRRAEMLYEARHLAGELGQIVAVLCRAD